MTDEREQIETERPQRPRRRVLIGVGIAVLAVLLLVVVPGYVATRPSFFGRYPAFEKQHAEWARSSHAAVTCQQCHAKPNVFAQSIYTVRMAAEFYPALFTRSRVPSAFPDPSNEACIQCHSDLRAVSPKGDLQIPHKAHVNILKMRCVQCHDRHLVHFPGPGGENVPTMAGCLSCHDGETASNACTDCHTEKAVPVTHRAADWDIVHADVAKKGTAECDKCHGWVDDWCVDCHKRRPASHTEQWRATHRDQVAKRRNCEACHAAAFCERCHGEVPQLNYNPELRLVQ